MHPVRSLYLQDRQQKILNSNPKLLKLRMIVTGKEVDNNKIKKEMNLKLIF